MREKDIEKKLKDGVKNIGGRSYKFVSPGNSGVPDRIVITPNGDFIFVELKAKNGRLSSIQKLQIKRLENLRQRVVVLKGEEEVDQFLNEIKGGGV